MKIRSGFVSNSSSSSFILIADTEIPPVEEILNDYRTTQTAENCFGDKYYLYSEKVHEFFKEDPPVKFVDFPWKKKRVYITVDTTGEFYFNRSDIRVVKTIEEKIQYIFALYCLDLTREEKITPSRYFKAAIKARNKIAKLCKKHSYYLSMEIIPLSASKWERKTNYFVNVYTECNYTDSIVKMIDAEDTSELEKFIFNPKSFCILGGDEYEETFRLEFEEKQKIKANPYPYHRYADYPDHHKGDISYYEGDGTPVYYDYDYEWGEYEPYYYNTERIPDHITMEELEKEFPDNTWEENWELRRSQSNLPWNDEKVY